MPHRTSSLCFRQQMINLTAGHSIGLMETLVPGRGACPLNVFGSWRVAARKVLFGDSPGMEDSGRGSVLLL